MEITGPFLDRAKKRRKAPACWYLRCTTPKLNPDGTSVLDAEGKIVLKRHRPYYESKAKAEADKPSIRDQHEKTGSGEFLFDRQAAENYETALKIVGRVPLIEIAKFWRLHHPDKPKRKLAELLQAFLGDVKTRHGGRPAPQRPQITRRRIHRGRIRRALRGYCDPPGNPHLFCTYHVAKHQSAAKTALIMRHRGSAYTLHNSYRGLGVTQKDGENCFKIFPAPVPSPIRPKPMAKGIIRTQRRDSNR